MLWDKPQFIRVFRSLDKRGQFIKLSPKEDVDHPFVGKNISQVNYVCNAHAGTFRGLHFQLPPYEEDKLVFCSRGSILDVLVDMRLSSDKYLSVLTLTVSSRDEAQNCLFVPKGFAHGYQTLEDDTELIYLHSSAHHSHSERGINVRDPKLKIKLPLPISDISERDQEFEFL